MNDVTMFEECGEFPVVRTILEIDVDRPEDDGWLLLVLRYEAPVPDADLAQRMLHLCAFHRAA
jgi:hypothetical protein